MKKMTLMVLSLILLTTAIAFAGGDQNQQRHDGEKGQGQTKQERVNK